MLRLSDIVDELDARLRSVRSQAGRARKFKEESDRLKLLRTQVALVDWRQFTISLREQQEQAAKLTVEKQALQKQVASCEEQLAAGEEDADALQRQVQQANSKAADVRERIAQAESTRRSQLARSDELRQESGRLQKQLLTMTSRAGNAQQLVAETHAELTVAQQQFDEFNESVQAKQAELDLAAQALQECRTTIADSRQRHATTISSASQLETQLHALQSQRTTASALIDRAREQAQHAESVCSQLSEQVDEAQCELRQLHDEYQKSQQRLTTADAKLSDGRQQLAKLSSEKAELQERLTGARARATVLEELERRLDGLSAGAKEVLRLARDEPDGPLGNVRGLVADLLHVDADTASLVETALGQLANSLVVEQLNPALLKMSENEWAGRTSFLRLDVPLAASAVDRIDLSGQAGVVGRADEFVETAPDLVTLPRRLLGRYWFVDNLSTAMRLASGMGRGLSYVTVVGEVVGADGTLTVGPRQSASGLLSRRSELRALVDEIQEMEHNNSQLEARKSQLEATIEQTDVEKQRFTERHQGVAHRHNESKLKTASLAQRLEEAQQQLVEASDELTTAETQASLAETETTAFAEQLEALRVEQAQLEQAISNCSEQGNQLEAQVEALQRHVTDHRVALARCEQRRDGLLRQSEQLLHDHEEHDRALQETRDREAESRKQCGQLEQSVLTLSSELAELYHEKEILTAQLEQQSKKHEVRRQQRATVIRQVDLLREQLLGVQSALQQVELSLQQLDHQRGDLATRMKDDYAVELAVLASNEATGQSPEELSQYDSPERAEIDAEIEQLKQRLQGLGPVNLEALSELEAVEERHSTLAQQYEDLRTAKAQLQQLVTQINTESRQIFMDSLDVIRGHFQELYSSLFGGGEADIILENRVAGRELREGTAAQQSKGSSQLSTHDSQLSADPLECGIDIVARPPGKQLRSISLLSGGERTMTCVALLLAIFRSRPSPFCVLDEVDAALDEANIDRFVEVLKQFMGSTQFVVVTHSKRTMACADTLYGVTMQESGVSKRVSVRFEDVTADGHIRQAA